MKVFGAARESMKMFISLEIKDEKKVRTDITEAMAQRLPSYHLEYFARLVIKPILLTVKTLICKYLFFKGL